MRREGFLVVALSAALCGCSGEVQEQPAAAADYEGYAAVIAQLDEVQSYQVSTVSTDEDYGEDYAYEERSETTVSVGEEGDSASETTMSYHVYEDESEHVLLPLKLRSASSLHMALIKKTYPLMRSHGIPSFLTALPFYNNNLSYISFPLDLKYLRCSRWLPQQSFLSLKLLLPEASYFPSSSYCQKYGKYLHHGHWIP